MPRQSDQQPTIVRRDDGDEEHSHPAFGFVSANRVNGGAVLYGSDFIHQGYVRLSIGPSTLRRNLSNDWPHPGRPFIQVDMSEAQWASLLSSMNVGQGVQCTIRRRESGDVPQIPEPVNRTEQFTREAQGRLDAGLQVLRELATQVEGMGLPKGKTAEILGALQAAQQQLGPNVAFVAEQFREHLETAKGHARTEINAYATNTLSRLGLAKLAQAGHLPLPLALPGVDDADEEEPSGDRPRG